MRKILIHIIVLTALISLYVPTLAAGITQAVMDTADSVFYVEVTNVQSVYSGTAFIARIINDTAYYITNYHVVQPNPNNVSIWINEKEKTKADIVKYSEQYDLALLKTPARDTMRAVEFSNEFKRGEGVYAIGFPSAADVLSSQTAHVGKDATISDGVISNIRSLRLIDYGPEISILQISAVLNPGNSGGPLANSRGKIIGVNTFGVEESQGIFGAISVTDINDFLNGTGVVLRFAEAGTLSTLLWSGSGAIILAAVFLTVRIIGRKAKKHGSYRKRMSLEQYIEQFPDKLNIISVTSLMMPLALYLRDKHTRGELSLKLSPKYVRVTEKGCEFDENRGGDGFIQQRFVSPEQLRNMTAGLHSDIYSFCAIMEYMLPKALMPETPEEVEFRTILKKGMALEPSDRYQSMQDLIYALSPYNSGITKELFVKTVSLHRETAIAARPLYKQSAASFIPSGVSVDTVEQSAPKADDGIKLMDIAVSTDAPKKAKKKRGGVFKACVTVAAAIGIVVLYIAVNYIGARVSILHDNFTAASKFLSLLVFDEQVLPDDRAYVNAGLELNNGDYDEAIYAFSMTKPLYNSADMLNEALYQKAAYSANTNDFDRAVSLYERLGNYKDSAKLVGKTLFREGYYLISQKEYSESVRVIRLLKDENYPDYENIILDVNYQCAISLIADNKFLDSYDYLTAAGDYADAEEVMVQLIEELYLEGQDYYHNWDYDNAKVVFSKLDGYSRSNDYISLCAFHKPGSFSEYTGFVEDDKVMTILAPMIGFEDTAELLVSRVDYAQAFLTGAWRGEGYYFTMKDDGHITYNLPWFDFGDYYSIADGYMILEDEETGATKKQWFITVFSENCIIVDALKNGGTYTLYRQ